MTFKRWVVGIIVIVCFPVICFFLVKALYDRGEAQSQKGLMSVCQVSSVAEVISENFQQVEKLHRENRTALLLELFNRKVSEECPSKLLKLNDRGIINYTGAVIDLKFVNETAAICSSSSLYGDDDYNLNYLVSQGKVFPSEDCKLK